MAAKKAPAKKVKKPRPSPAGKPRPRTTLDAEGLTPKQAAFKRHLLDGMTITEAYTAAKVSKASAFKWMKEEPFASRLAEGRKQLEDAGVCTRIDIMRELWKVGSSDVRLLFGNDDTLLPPEQWPDRIAAAVASVKTHELYEGAGKDRRLVGYSREVKLHPKVSALEQVGRMLGAFAPPKAPVGPDGKPVKDSSTRKVFLIPAKRSEEDMAGYGRPVIEGEKVVQALPEEAPPQKRANWQERLLRIAVED